MASQNVTGPATLPLTYHDLVAVDDLDPTGKETQSDLETLEQDVLHILQENLGSNLDDISRGLGMASLLSGTSPPLIAAAATADSQLTQDPRIDAATTVISQPAVNSFLVQVTISVAGATIGLVYASTAAGGLLPFQGSRF